MAMLCPTHYVNQVSTGLFTGPPKFTHTPSLLKSKETMEETHGAVANFAFNSKLTNDLRSKFPNITI